MAATQPAARPSSRERGPSSNYSIRSPGDNDRASVQNGGFGRSPDENRIPLAMPKGLGGMLKTTTETGDIGLFSIKPSRVPHPVNSPRRMSGSYQDDAVQKPRRFQPYGVPNIDDRRRLPSYARDASSEVISMYETASQKSASRNYNDPDYRSYSMTQTYSSYSLSNHRSYASLRSQPDAGSMLQRPRSPFAYPARLKRPGFRPSSPALTDGGAVDYSRRAEIDRMPYGANHHTSSPASLYAQKRKPQLSLRPEANRSTPSLLSQSSPQRRSPSPNMRQRSGTPSNDWQRRNGPASVNTSPARSTFSLASTVNLYQSAQVPSTTTTPGKIPPPSPLYYDYTEDFDIDDYSQPEPLEPPPQFRIEKTIPEDRPLSSDWKSLDGSDMRDKQSFSSDPRNSSSTASIPQKSHESSQDSSITTQNTSIAEPAQGHQSREVATTTEEDTSKNVTAKAGDRKTIRLSGLGLGARELSTHVEEVFGLPPTRSFEVIVSDNIANGDKIDQRNAVQEENDREIPSVRSSSYSLNTHLGRFPTAPGHLDGQFSETDADQHMSSKSRTGVPLPLQHSLGSVLQVENKDSAALGMGHQIIGDSTISVPLRSLSARSDRKRLIRPYSIDNGLSELDEHINAFEDANRTKVLGEKINAQDSSKVLPAPPSTLPNGLVLGNTLSSQRFHPPSSSFSQLNVDSGYKGLSDHGLKRSHQRQRARRLEAMTVPTVSESDVPNFSHQFPRKLISRSESPMLAPKPISPARQLKLKNSVPQLMKALPPVPPDPPVCVVPPPVLLALSEVELPCRFSPLISEPRATPPQEPPKPATITKLLDDEPVKPTEKISEPVEQDFVPRTIPVPVEDKVNEDQTTHDPQPPPKLKLKKRSSFSLRPSSPPESRPWNAEESYPWSNQTFNVGLPSVVQEDKATKPKPPKFKLKITRASNSTVGTVRVNRESGDSRPSIGLHLRHPKDLFTPSSGIDNIFRQVSKHLHSRKASASSNYPPDERELISTSISDQISLTQSLSSEPNSLQASQASLNATSPTEVRSFFSDDSSHRHQGGHGLRKRLSNLRARIVVPYGVASGVQSHDDITWRDRNGREAPISPASRSISNLYEGRASTEARPLRRLVERTHAQKLRARFTVWFKGARSAIRARVKS